MNKQFSGNKVLVIGGTSGMGLATARQVIVGQRSEKAQAAQQALSALGSVEALVADLTSEAGVGSLLNLR